MPIGRRAFVGRVSALIALPVLAKAPAPPKTANIRWPGPGYDLHGYMAIPGPAKGPQSAVLLIHDAGGADAFVRGMADSIAQAGFVACAPASLASLDEAVATVRWLATNAYATGKVAAVGLGWGGALAERLAASPGAPLSAVATFGGSAQAAQITTPLLTLDPIGHMDATAYGQAWLRLLDFLKEHLA